MNAQVVAMRQQYDAAGADADRLTAELKDVKSRDVGYALVAQQNVAVDGPMTSRGGCSWPSRR